MFGVSYQLVDTITQVQKQRWVIRIRFYGRGTLPANTLEIKYTHLLFMTFRYQVNLGDFPDLEIKVFLTFLEIFKDILGPRSLTHRGRDEMAAISQTIFSNAFS